MKVGFTGGIIANIAARIPHKIAMELLLVGEPIDGERAYEVGYVNKVIAVRGPHADGARLCPPHRRHRAAASRALKRFVAETLPKGPTELAGMAGAQTSHLRREDWVEGRRPSPKAPANYKARHVRRGQTLPHRQLPR